LRYQLALEHQKLAPGFDSQRQHTKIQNPSYLSLCTIHNTIRILDTSLRLNNLLQLCGAFLLWHQTLFAALHNDCGTICGIRVGTRGCLGHNDVLFLRLSSGSERNFNALGFLFADRVAIVAVNVAIVKVAFVAFVAFVVVVVGVVVVVVVVAIVVAVVDFVVALSLLECRINLRRNKIRNKNTIGWTWPTSLVVVIVAHLLGTMDILSVQYLPLPQLGIRRGQGKRFGDDPFGLRCHIRPRFSFEAHLNVEGITMERINVRRLV
jgi:hypothetical protein